MTRKEAKEAIKVMQAYADGNEIEALYRGVWESCEDPLFCWGEYDYRIKHKHKYRPFYNGKECFEEMRHHQPLGWIKDAKSEEHSYYIIDSVCKEGCIIMGNALYSYDGLLECFTFADGTHFGIEVDE